MICEIACRAGAITAYAVSSRPSESEANNAYNRSEGRVDVGVPSWCSAVD